ncbi:amidase signature enzyme [Hyphopichia burtonii NRRL Y-1933]|uniref:Amidase signature enzyme n=1 Tax=Hyphopichia burtonii NRRL Y-1933 TaxID=984485 RepID=A0A1E4RNN6_9ASCO|nr:amidase signature enzyme [Hyphopichia burtonii NRRL Y-1933]ODV68846.1 amidase signature enzyme [Hyphopichia burtonii NRRL Y-1933]
MTVSYTQFLTKETFESYENSEKYAKFVPKLKAYRQKLEDAILPEYSIELPDTIESLKNKQFNSVKYLYEHKLLSETEFNITDTPASELVPKLAKGRPFSITENRQLNIIRDTLKQEYTDFLNENKIDFILSPTYNNVAPRPEEIYNWSYTSLFNILDLPTLVFQTGLFQDPKVDKWDDSHSTYEFRSDLEKLELDNYIPENFIGAPIGLQLSGRRYFDEEVVAAGKSIIELLKVDLHNIY